MIKGMKNKNQTREQIKSKLEWSIKKKVVN